MATSDSPLNVPNVTLAVARGASSPPASGAPTAPPVFTTAAASNSISAIVSEPNGATRYNVRVDNGIAEAGSVKTGLAASTSYSFQLQGENDSGVSDWSNAVDVTTTAVGEYTAKTPVERRFKIDINAVGGTLGVRPEAPDGRLNGKDVFQGNTWGSTYSNEIQIDGQNVLKCTVDQGSTGEGLGGSCYLDSHASAMTRLYRGDEIWLKTRIRFPSASWQWNIGRNKFFRTRFDDTSGNYTDLYCDGNFSFSADRQFWWISEASQSWSNVVGEYLFSDTDHDVEMYFVIDHLAESEGGQALQRVWIDGQLIIESTKPTLKTEAGNYYLSALFMYYGNDTAPADLHFYVKEFITQTSVPAQRDAAGNPFIGV